jgi:2-phospho-L-lactate guanylyltransferase
MKKKAFAVIPAKKFENSKTRLSPILDAKGRAELARLMLHDTLATLGRLDVLYGVLVVSSDKRAQEIAQEHGATFILEGKDAGVNSAVALADRYCIDAGADASIVVPQDLPLLNVADLAEFFTVAQAADRRGCIAICPSLRYDGTNVLLRMPPAVIRTHYDNNSYEMHVKAARDAGAAVHVIRAERLMFDIDTPGDVARLRAVKEEITARATAEFLLSRVAP